MPHRFLLKLGACFALAGAVLLLIGTFLHPAHADPNAFAAAFSEYAHDPHWIASHLIQLAGVLCLLLCLSLLTRTFTSEISATFAHVASFLAAVSLSVGAVLQAVDGIALKPMAAYWLDAAAPDKQAFFAATLATRHIEIGLASIFALFSGVTVAVFGLAMATDSRFRFGLSWPAIISGAITFIGGLVMAYSGFSDAAMLINMAANIPLLLWALALGFWMFRNAR